MNKLMKLKRDKKGFTLIEIVIVIVIIAILAAMLIPNMISWIDESRQSTFRSEANSVKSAVETEIANAFAMDTVPPTGHESWSGNDNPHWAKINSKFNKLGLDATKVQFKVNDEGTGMEAFYYKDARYSINWTAEKNWDKTVGKASDAHNWDTTPESED